MSTSYYECPKCEHYKCALISDDSDSLEDYLLCEDCGSVLVLKETVKADSEVSRVNAYLLDSLAEALSKPL